MAELITFKVRDNVDKFAAQLRQLSDDVRDKATVSALNKMAAQVKTQASRAIRDAGYNLKASIIKKQLSMRRATASRLTASVIATGKTIPIIYYSARQTSRGVVSVSVLNGRKVFKNAFIATMPSGHKGVFVRVGPKIPGNEAKPNRRHWKYQKIEEKFGPGIPDALANEAVTAALTTLVQDKFPTLIANEIKYFTPK
ncbi:MAG: phage tail protein [Leptothrix sp. (in: b-proteobacteria)]